MAATMGDNILSTKVSRAISVRTDTPAMLSALEALAGLDADSGAGGSKAAPIDPRSIRSTIEQSALTRALAFQAELQKLSDAATELRKRAEGVERVAGELERRSGGGVVVDFVDAAGAGGEEDEWKKEQTLATRLYQAHQSYLNSTKRRIAVEAFLEKFDLNEEETRLLDTFDFEKLRESPLDGSSDDAMAFLSALERLAVIRRELESEWDEDETTSKQRRIGTHSALRMMEQLATRQERAHERLYQFIQFYLGVGTGAPKTMSNVPTSSDAIGHRMVDPSMYEEGIGRFRDGDEMDEAYANLILRRSLHVLRNSPARYVHALEMIASSRRTEVTRRFLLALTSGYGGMAPLEMRAHDAVGYVGDMLAFAFRSFRVEGELVKMLFVWREDDDGEEGASTKTKSDAMEEDESEEKGEDQEVSKPMDVVEMLGQSMGGMARPLGTRIKQVVKSLVSRRELEGQDLNMAGDVLDARSRIMMEGGDDEDVGSSSLNQIVSLFSICGLLKFYCSAVQNASDKLEQMVLHDDGMSSNESGKNPLFTTCVESLVEASESYVASLRTYGAMLGSHSTTTDTEAQLAQRLIVRIAEERVASPGFADDSSLDLPSEVNVCSRQLSLSFLVRTVIDAAIPYLKSLDDGAALKSALNVTGKCGLESSEAKKWIDLVQEKETGLVEELVENEADKVLGVCGLGGIQVAMNQMSAVYVEGMTMSSHPGLSPADIKAAMKQFYSSLYSPPIPTFEESIKDPELRKVARSKTAKRVVNEYRKLYDAITSEKGGYADLSFLGHDPDQVCTLLSM